MPIYEYQCKDCDEQFTVFIRSFADIEKREKSCPSCGRQNLRRLVSQVAVISSESNRPATPPGSTQESSRELATIMRDASSKLGNDLGPEFHEVAHRLEKGENPKKIERSLRKRVGQSMEDAH